MLLGEQSKLFNDASLLAVFFQVLNDTFDVMNARNLKEAVYKKTGEIQLALKAHTEKVLYATISGIIDVNCFSLQVLQKFDFLSSTFKQSKEDLFQSILMLVFSATLRAAIIAVKSMIDLMDLLFHDYGFA